MNLADVMDEVGDALDLIDGLRVWRWPPDSAAVPAAIVSYPDDVTFDATFGRGSDTMTIPVVVAVGSVTTRTARDLLGAYCDGSGPSSVKATIEGATFTACDTPVVQSVEFDTYELAGVVMVAAIFDLLIVGSGTA